MADKQNPIRPTDDDARALARNLLDSSTTASLAVLDPDTHGPFVSLIALHREDGGSPVSLVSDLSFHTRALRTDPRACLLLGGPGPRGDPLNHARLSLTVQAAFVPREGPDHASLRAAWLARHPKSRLYLDFADFSFIRFEPVRAMLNGGFGQAYSLTAEDLRLP